MKNSVIVHTYVDNLINNPDGKYDNFGSAWFKVPVTWLSIVIKISGFLSLEEFFNNYTYDDSDGLLQKAVEDGVLLGCGTGDMGQESKEVVETVSEWCSNCGVEVELPYIFQSHICPNCNISILPCAQCETQACKNCPLA